MKKTNAPNIRTIAKEAKVSIATVSRFFDSNKSKLVHPDTCLNLERIVKKYNYTPNRTARSLSKQSTETIGMVTPFSTDVVKSPYFEGLISGIIEGIRPLQYDLKWIMIRDEDAETLDLNTLLQKHSVDGIVFLSWRLLPHLVYEIEHRANIPAVLINDYDPKVRSSIVYCENKNGIEQICFYFRSKGYRKVGMLRGPEHISHDARGRYLAFRHYAKKFGLQIKNEFLYECPAFNEEMAYQAILKADHLPEALFCANDDFACGAIRALRKKKIRIPEQIAVVGFDDSKRSETISPSLTTVRQPLEAMGRAAMETLWKLISKKAKAPMQLKFEPELVIRESA